MQSQNIDAMLSEELGDTTRNHHRQGANDFTSLATRNQQLPPQLSRSSQVKTMKYVTNQLLDKDGQLLTEH